MGTTFTVFMYELTICKEWTILLIQLRKFTQCQIIKNGLKQIGNATYTETAVSGTPQVGEAGSEGFGNILSGSLERSNVDITEELVNLITAQRNFQASAKAIETTTGLTQTIINIRM